MMCTAELTTPVAFPAGLDMHWETENRVMWNERERVSVLAKEINTDKRRVFTGAVHSEELSAFRGNDSRRRRINAENLGAIRVQ